MFGVDNHPPTPTVSWGRGMWPMTPAATSPGSPGVEIDSMEGCKSLLLPPIPDHSAN